MQDLTGLFASGVVAECRYSHDFFFPIGSVTRARVFVFGRKGHRTGEDRGSANGAYAIRGCCLSAVCLAQLKDLALDVSFEKRAKQSVRLRMRYRVAVRRVTLCDCDTLSYFLTDGEVMLCRVLSKLRSC